MADNGRRQSGRVWHRVENNTGDTGGEALKHRDKKPDEQTAIQKVLESTKRHD